MAGDSNKRPVAETGAKRFPWLRRVLRFRRNSKGSLDLWGIDAG